MKIPVDPSQGPTESQNNKRCLSPSLNTSIDKTISISNSPHSICLSWKMRRQNNRFLVADVCVSLVDGAYVGDDMGVLEETFVDKC